MPIDCLNTYQTIIDLFGSKLPLLFDLSLSDIIDFGEVTEDLINFNFFYSEIILKLLISLLLLVLNVLIDAEL